MNETKGTPQTRARHSARGIAASGPAEPATQTTAPAGRTSADYVQMLRFPVLVGLSGFAVALTLMALWPRSSGPGIFNASGYGQLPWPVGSGSPPAVGAPGATGTATAANPSGTVSAGAGVVTASNPSSAASGARPSQPGATAPPPTGAGAPPAQQTTFSAVAGPGCTSGSVASFNAVGYWTGGEGAWLSDSGGLATSGCSGTFLAMPMSGNATQDGGNGGAWTFVTGANAGSCATSVYIPAVSNPVYNGGDPGYYSVQNSASGGSTLNTVAVNQEADAGEWVSLGKYSAPSSGVIEVELADRGIDFTSSGPDYAHFSVDAVQVVCTK